MNNTTHTPIHRQPPCPVHRFSLRHLFTLSPLHLIIPLLLSTLYCPLRAADAPLLIPFQAQLTDSSGQLITNGPKTIIFNLYEQAIGGASKWTERHEKVGIINGSVNVFLGSIEPFPPGKATPSPTDRTFFSKTRYLGITIDEDGNPTTPEPEMVPRQIIIPAFHAMNSEKLQGFGWESILKDNGKDPENGHIKGSKIEEEGITNLQIRNGEIKTDEIADGAITVGKFAHGALNITTDRIVNNTILGEDLSDGSVSWLKQARRTIVKSSGPGNVPSAVNGQIAVSAAYTKDDYISLTGESNLTKIDDLSIEIKSTGNPIRLSIEPNSGVNSTLRFQGSGFTGYLFINRISDSGDEILFRLEATSHERSNLPTLNFLDDTVKADKTYKYYVQVSGTNNERFYIKNMRLIGYEI